MRSRSPVLTGGRRTSLLVCRVALAVDPDAACLEDEDFSVVMLLRSVMVKPP
jgi:hypothetical protein